MSFSDTTDVVQDHEKAKLGLLQAQGLAKAKSPAPRSPVDERQKPAYDPRKTVTRPGPDHARASALAMAVNKDRKPVAEVAEKPVEAKPAPASSNTNSDANAKPAAKEMPTKPAAPLPKHAEAPIFADIHSTAYHGVNDAHDARPGRSPPFASSSSSSQPAPVGNVVVQQPAPAPSKVASPKNSTYTHVAPQHRGASSDFEAEWTRLNAEGEAEEEAEFEGSAALNLQADSNKRYNFDFDAAGKQGLRKE